MTTGAENESATSKVIQKSNSGGYSTFTNSERKTFVRYVNDVMQQAQSSSASPEWVPIPVDPVLDPDDELLSRFHDGRLLCTLLGHSVDGSIDTKVINKGKNLSKFQIIENLNLALKAAKEIGCVVVNIGYEDIMEGKPHAILGILWQVLRIDLLNDVSVLENVQVIALKQEGESLEQFMKLDDRDVLLRWVNYQMNKSGKNDNNDDDDDDDNNNNESVKNFGTDLKNSSVYVKLLRTVAPHLVSEEEVAEIMQEEDLLKRAERVIELGNRLDMHRKIYIDPQDIVSGSTRMNTAYIAAIFESSKDSSLATPETEDPQKMIELRTQMLDIVVAELAKDLPSVRSNKFTSFIQAAKNLTQVTRTSFEEGSLLEKLRKTQEDAFEAKQQLKTVEERVTQEYEQRIETIQSQNNSEWEEQLQSISHELSETKEQLAEKESTLTQTEETLRHEKEEAEQNRSQLEQQLTQVKQQMEQNLQDHERQLKEETERASELQVQLSDMHVTTENLQQKMEEQQDSYESKLTQEQDKSSDLERQLEELKEQMQKQKEDYERQLQDLRDEMKQKTEELEGQLSELQTQYAELEGKEKELQEANTKQNENLEKMNEQRNVGTQKSKDLVKRLLKLKEVLRQTREDLDYGMSMAGVEAETKLALHRFGDISAPGLQTTATRVGQMYKRGTKVKTWKKRFHILVQNYLFYYGSVKDKEPKGFIRVDDCIVEALPDSNKPHSFKVLVKSRELVCHCESQKEMDSWIFAIREAGNLDIVTSSDK